MAKKFFLVGHYGALGDFILTWPALFCLKKLFPTYNFIGIGHQPFLQLAIQQGIFNKGYDMDSANMVNFFTGKFLPKDIPPPDGAALWQINKNQVVELLEIGATLPVVAINPYPPVDVHVAKYYCEELSLHFNLDIPENLANFYPSQKNCSDYVLIHPGSGSLAKNQQPYFYLKLAGRLRSMGITNIRYIMGPVEKELNIDDFFLGEAIEYSNDLNSLVSILQPARLYIGNDSGVSHLAAALGTPTIALYKTTDPKIWGVIGKKVMHIKTDNIKNVFAAINRSINKLLV